MEDTPPPDERRPRDRRRDEDDEPRRRRPRDEEEEEEEWSDRDRPRRRRRAEPDPALKFVVPLNTSPLAILAGYLGLVSVLCLPAPFALVLGLLALRSLKKNPKLDGKGRAIFAIVMGTVFSGVMVVALISWAANGFK